VDHDVVDRACEARQRLRLLLRAGLVVEAAQRAHARVFRDVALRHRRRNTALGELAGAGVTAERTAVVGVRLRLDQPDTIELQRFELHPIVSVVGSPGSGTMISPRHPCSARIWAMISSRKFQASNSTLSGWRVKPSAGAVMGMSVPGV